MSKRSPKNIVIHPEKPRGEAVATINTTAHLPYMVRRHTPTVVVSARPTVSNNENDLHTMVKIGSAHPVVVQAMTNTDTADINSTVAQIIDLSDAGAEMVRITVNNKEAAAAVPAIYAALDKKGYSIPIVGDFHYNGDQLLRDFPDCAQALAKYRINPGNAGAGEKKGRSFSVFIETALRYQKPVRIGVNWGSLDQSVLGRMMDENSKRSEPWPAWAVMREALVTSAIESAQLAQSMGLPDDKIILSCKVSQVPDLIAVYRTLAQRCHYALHLGLTEAGLGDKGIVASTAGIATLLAEGIGDTIRVSLTPAPNDSRTREVVVAQEILQGLGLRTFFPSVTACPGCGRTTSVFFQELAGTVQQHLRDKMPQWREKHKGVDTMTVAVMGCVVNGPGESRHANIGISLPGTGEQPSAPVFVDGQRVTTLKGDHIAQQFITLIDAYVDSHY